MPNTWIRMDQDDEQDIGEPEDWAQVPIRGGYDPAILASQGYFDTLLPADRIWQDSREL